VSEKISFWLIPAAEHRSLLQNLINQLASQYSAPRFTPHVTLCYGDFSTDTLATMLQQASQTVKSFQLQVDCLLYTDQFTKTLFIQLHPSFMLSQIANTLKQGAIVPSNYQLDPHLSLIYKTLEEFEQQKLVAKIELPLTEIWFDQVWAISTSDSVQNREDVESWRVLHTFELSSELSD
jgi:2'-5' RNA ligase